MYERNVCSNTRNSVPVTFRVVLTAMDKHFKHSFLEREGIKKVRLLISDITEPFLLETKC